MLFHLDRQITMTGPKVSCGNSFSQKTIRPITHLHLKTQYAVSCAYSYALKPSGTPQRYKGLLTSFSKHQTTKVSDGCHVKLHAFFTSREMRSHFTFGSGNPSEDTDETAITYRSRMIKRTNAYFCVNLTMLYPLYRLYVRLYILQ